MKKIALLVVIVTGAFLMYTVQDFPDFADPNSPASTHVSPYYLEQSLHDTAVPNVVTSVLADYRGFDTMFETTVVFVAGIAIVFLLRCPRKRQREIDLCPDYKESCCEIVEVACRILIPLTQLFALYVIAHGHHSPGGGFQGGVILATTLILLAFTYGLKAALKRLTEKSTIVLSSIGILMYTGIGIICMLLGGNFLDYSVLSTILPGVSPVMARSYGILVVEIGVAITVMTVMFSIYADLSSEGKLDKGI